MKRNTAKTIFRTVVLAGALLATGACAKKQAAAPPATPAGATEATPAAETPTPTEGAPAGDAGDKAAEDPDQGGEAHPEHKH